MKEHVNTKILVIDDIDRQIFELVSIMPQLSKPMAWFSGIINLVLPGFGTMMATCSTGETVSKTHFLIGIL